MKRPTLPMVLTLTMLLCCSTAFAAPDIDPGQWQFTTTTEMQGAANMKVPAQTHVQCITEQDLVPMSQGASQECQVSDVEVDGDTVSWRISCGGQSQMEGTGQITYGGDSMEGTMNMVISATGMQVTNHITGRRIGACNGQAAASAVRKPSAVEEALTEDARDIGQAARDEAKQTTIDEVREGVRGMFKSLFD